MNATWMIRAIWGAGLVHLGIIAANVPLPGRLRVRERLAGVPKFVRQIFYVHWIYIVLVLGLFAALSFGFAEDLAGASALGRFLSGFMAGFWLLRVALQIFYYDREVRRENLGLDLIYVGALVVLVVIFGIAVVRPVA
jgi:UDP-N-acetylmuramyl pentapeptide phosphotransferase/UDP-N-acetylglucosamine-1-phosphate transferase